MHYCDHAKMSVVHPSIVIFSHFRLPLWNHWTEFNETWQEARFQRPLPSLCFSGRSKANMASPDSDWLRHFRLLLWNCWTEFNENWQEARYHRFYHVCVFRADRKTKMTAPAFDWLSMQDLRKQDLNVLYQVYILGTIGKPRWPTKHLIGWGIFYFSSEIGEWNPTKHDRKQDLDVLY